MIDYRRELATSLESLIRELKTIAIYHETTDDWEVQNTDNESITADENTLADTSELSAEREATLALLENRYRNIKRALKKIEADEFGICEICHIHIEPERLTANPAARTCIQHREEESRLPL